MPPPRVTNSQDTQIFGHRDADKISGVLLGVITSGTDPSNQGRVQVSIPSLSATMWGLAAYSPVPVKGAGDPSDTPLRSGAYQVGDAVVVAFLEGDLAHPVVVGRVGA